MDHVWHGVGLRHSGVCHHRIRDCNQRAVSELLPVHILYATLYDVRCTCSLFTVQSTAVSVRQLGLGEWLYVPHPGPP